MRFSSNFPLIGWSVKSKKFTPSRLIDWKGSRAASLANHTIDRASETKVPSDISWMVNEGRLAPVVDVVQALRDEAAGTGGKGGGAADDIAKAGGMKSAAKKEVSRCRISKHPTLLNGLR